MTEQTEQTEWRCGDVVVTEGVPHRYWRVSTDRYRHVVDKELCPDPQALADFVASQRPKPRFYVKPSTSVSWHFGVMDDERGMTVAAVADSGTCDARTIAEHLADWLNEQEADR